MICKAYIYRGQNGYVKYSRQKPMSRFIWPHAWHRVTLNKQILLLNYYEVKWGGGGRSASSCTTKGVARASSVLIGHGGRARTCQRRPSCTLSGDSHRCVLFVRLYAHTHKHTVQRHIESTHNTNFLYEGEKEWTWKIIQ